MIPLWAFSATPLLLGIGAFLMQVAVQGAWGIVPVHLNELSPGAVRATFPGFAYQIGNLLASKNVVFQTGIAETRGDNYGLALALFARRDGDRHRDMDGLRPGAAAPISAPKPKPLRHK